MRIHMHPFSQHSRRVLMLCRELGLEVETVPVALDKGEHKSASFARLSRTSRVPVLEDGTFALSESHAIMRYLSAAHGDRAFYPADAKKRGAIDMWLDWNHTALNPPIQTVAIQIFFMRDKADKALVAQAHDQAREALKTLNSALEAQDGLGGAPNLADLSIASTIALYEMAGGDISGHPAVTKWFEAIKKRPSFQETAPTMN